MDQFHRFAAVGMGDDHPVAAFSAVVADFVAELLAIAIEKPNHAAVENSARQLLFPGDDYARRRSCSLGDVRVR